MTTVAAAAGVRAAIAQQQATEINRKYYDQLGERRAKEREYEAALRMEAYEREQARRRQMQSWFAKYDTDASGVLEVAELQEMLHELYPEEPAPSEELCQMLITMCVGVNGVRRGIRLEEVMATSSRFHDYVKRKAEVDRAFEKLDQDGNGFIEEEELVDAMTNLVPRHQSPLDADLAFVYGACGLKRGAPISVTAMPALMPALAEWAEFATAAAHVIVDGTPQSKPKPTRSSFCVVM